MTTGFMKVLGGGAVFGALCWQVCAGELNNIALGRGYELSPGFSIANEVEYEDHGLLTDGQKDGALWRRLTTIAWRNKAEVVLDLGYVREFDAVKVHTRSPGARWANAIVAKVEASDDGKRFTQVGAWDKSMMDWPGLLAEMSRLNYSGSAYTPFIKTPGAKGRFVRVHLESEKGSLHIPLDEVEVLSSAPALVRVEGQRQEQDGSYALTVKAERGVESVALLGLTPWGETLLEKAAKPDGAGLVEFKFSMPSELCHVLRIVGKDKAGGALELCQRWLDYGLPANVKPTLSLPLEDGWQYQFRKPSEDLDPAAWKELDLARRRDAFAAFTSSDAEPYMIFYKKLFTASKGAAQQFSLKFNRIRYAPTVMLNGHLVGGDILEPTLPQTYDVTPFLKDGPNELIVRTGDWRNLLVSGPGPLALKSFGQFQKETWFAMAPSITDAAVQQGKASLIHPLGNDKTRFGILAGVELLVTPNVFIESVRATPDLKSERVFLDLDVRNATASTCEVELDGVVGDIADARILKIPATKLTISPSTTRQLRLEVSTSDLKLWWPKAPNLQHACLTLRMAGETVHTKEIRFGVRQVEAVGTVLKINGMPLHLFGTHDGVYFSHIELFRLSKYNFNTFRTQCGASTVELLSAADEMGFLVIEEGLAFASFINAGQLFWDNCYAHFKRRALRDWNHPSVIAYSTQNEFLDYTCPWAPSEWVHARMDEWIKRMVAFDPSRLHGHEGSYVFGSGFGSCSGSETILLPHYGAEGSEDGEYLLPNFYHQWLEKLKDAAWGKRPVYLGEMALAWDFRVNLPDPSTMYNLGDGVYRGFRSRIPTCEVKAIENFLPWEIDAMRGGGMVGLSPNTWSCSPRLREITRQGFSPFYARLEDYRKQLFGGMTAERRVIVHNDWLDGAKERRLVLAWKLVADGKTLDEGRSKLSIASGAFAETTISVAVPDVPEREEASLALTVEEDGKPLFARADAVSIFPKLGPLASAKRLAVHDPAGTSGSFLKALGLPVAAADLTKLNPREEILVVGRGGVDDKLERSKDAIASFVAKGGIVVALAQRDGRQWLPLPLALDNTHPSTLNYLRASGHPLLAGVKEDDLKLWGVDNIVADANYKKPVLGGFRALADTAGVPGLLWTPLLEVPHGKGAYILCQLKLEEKWREVPCAGILLRNLLNYANAPRPAPSALALLKPCGDGLRQLLLDTGAAFTETDLSAAPDSGVLLVDCQAIADAKSAGALKALAAKGATVVLHNMSPKSPLTSLLPAGASLKPVLIDSTLKSVIHTGYEPLTWGLSNQSLYWLGPSPSLSASSGGIWGPSPKIADYALALKEGGKAKVLLDPALLVEVQEGDGKMLFDQIRWDTAQANHRLKALEYLRNLCVNLNLPLTANVPKPKRCLPLDLAKHCNMGFLDEVAGDGKGGWTDQGPLNDLRSLPVGPALLGGVLFDIVDPAKNHGKSCLVLKSAHAPWGLEKAAGIPVNHKAKALHFLHAAAWESPSAMAKYVINYADGSKEVVAVVGGKNIGGWWKPSFDVAEASVVWTGPNIQAGEVGLYLHSWKNPRPEKEISSLDVVSSDTAATPGLVGVSLELE